MQVDHLIIGQGLCGTLLSRQLIKAGRSVLVIDDNNPSAPTRTAGGIINPVTGKRLVRSWLIETLLPFAKAEYSSIEQEFNTSLMHSTPILDLHLTTEARNLFNDRTQTETQYLQINTNDTDWHPYFRFNYGIGTIEPCYTVDLKTLLNTYRKHLTIINALLETTFDLQDVIISSDSIQYQNIHASSIIFCDGATSAENPFFEKLPWSKDKGEALILSIPDLPRNHIYKQGVSIVPLYGNENLFWVGASHDWNYTTTAPTDTFRKSVTTHLDHFLKLPYKVVDHTASLRPANFDRKPFIGFHPLHPQIGIFNGMGGKGCSLAPYFAHHFADHLVNAAPLMPDVNINRYCKILSK